jgi:hypothetical protein
MARQALSRLLAQHPLRIHCTPVIQQPVYTCHTTAGVHLSYNRRRTPVIQPPAYTCHCSRCGAHVRQRCKSVSSVSTRSRYEAYGYLLSLVCEDVPFTVLNTYAAAAACAPCAAAAAAPCAHLPDAPPCSARTQFPGADVADSSRRRLADAFIHSAAQDLPRARSARQAADRGAEGLLRPGKASEYPAGAQGATHGGHTSSARRGRAIVSRRAGSRCHICAGTGLAPAHICTRTAATSDAVSRSRMCPAAPRARAYALQHRTAHLPHRERCGASRSCS